MNNNIFQLKKIIQEADAIVIGAGAGLSSAAGLSYTGKRFHQYFADFIEKYHFTDMYSAGFYPFETLEEYWAYWSRHIYYNRYDQPIREVYLDLLEIIKEKDYFVITTNVDHQFQLSGFDKQRLFYMQGDYGLWQCSGPCLQRTYDNESVVREMIRQQKDMKIPTSLIPYCPHCGKPLTMNLRCDETFVEDEGWHQGAKRYQQFIEKHRFSSIVYLELGVGFHTPGIIKYPFWQLTYQNQKAIYVCINQEKEEIPTSIRSQSFIINEDIQQVLQQIKS
ncbi:MAG: SIR2 family NAD-dependent protein deacylase [Longibaculum sp.]